MSTRTELSPTAVSAKSRLPFYAVWGLYTILFIALFGFIAPLLPILVNGWLDPAALGAHFYHEMLASALLWAALIGMAVQAHRPAAQLGGMMQSIVIFAAICLSILTGAFSFPPPFIFLILALVAAFLHPARAQLFARPGRRSPVLAGLTAAAALPLLLYAGQQIGLQRSAAPHDPHAEFGHWLLAGAYAMTILFLGLVSATRPPGWRLSAWSCGLLAILLGLLSLLHPAQASAVDPAWGAAALLWGVTFIAAAERFGRGASTPA